MPATCCPDCRRERELFFEFPAHGAPRLVCEDCGRANAADRQRERNYARQMREIDAARSFKRNGP